VGESSPDWMVDRSAPKRLFRLKTRLLVGNPDIAQQVWAEFRQVGKRLPLPSTLHPEVDHVPPASSAGWRPAGPGEVAHSPSKSNDRRCVKQRVGHLHLRMEAVSWMDGDEAG
jgi:hypothetical protein